jgi:hypothetical protein
MRIAREQRIEGVYGPLYSLLDIDERWKVAVEVTAGNRYVTCVFFLADATHSYLHYAQPVPRRCRQ